MFFTTLFLGSRLGSYLNDIIFKNLSLWCLIDTAENENSPACTFLISNPIGRTFAFISKRYTMVTDWRYWNDLHVFFANHDRINVLFTTVIFLQTNTEMHIYASNFDHISDSWLYLLNSNEFHYWWRDQVTVQTGIMSEWVLLYRSTGQ